MRTFRTVLVLLVLGSVLTGLVPARAASVPDKGVAWIPRPRSQPLYGTKRPDEAPKRQQTFVSAADEVDLFVETWLPAAKRGNKPPKKIPTILIMTPYVVEGQEEYPGDPEHPGFIEYFTARGYAVSQAHVRGTGESGGCLEQTAASQIDDGARVIEYLGRDAPWTNGRVGMFGVSYDAETQISTAGLGPPGRLKYLKAIVPIASVGSQYDWNFMDGVPWTGQPLIGNAGYLAAVSALPGQRLAPQHYPEKADCQDEILLASADTSGDYTDFWREREYRPGAPKVKAATLMVHGLRDFNVQPITLAGFFDHLPSTTPHKGLFGVWNHALPDDHQFVEVGWEREDWLDMLTAWYDRYLKRLPTGVESWPDVQVQSSTGQWWEVDEYPTTGGPSGHLVLGLKGELGSAKPEGTSVFQEQILPILPVNDRLVFQTPPMTAPLHLTGQPVLDLWVKSSQPDAHIGVELEVLGKDGFPIYHRGGEAVATYGVRSMQHIEPMHRGWFEQAEAKAFPVDDPTQVLIRFLPTDLEVPKGGILSLTVSGTVSYSKGESLPSGADSTITILHDCEHMSALRFLMPARRARLLNVLEADEGSKRPRSRPERMGLRDGDGLASAPVCGQKPRRVDFLR